MIFPENQTFSLESWAQSRQWTAIMNCYNESQLWRWKIRNNLVNLKKKTDAEFRPLLKKAINSVPKVNNILQGKEWL